MLIDQPDGDAAAGELLDMLGFDHVDDVSRIVSHRPVRHAAGPAALLLGAARCH